MFDAREFINNWSASFDWETAIANGEISVEDMMVNLRQLEADYEARGYRNETDEPIDWEAVERELRKHTK